MKTSRPLGPAETRSPRQNRLVNPVTPRKPAYPLHSTRNISFPKFADHFHKIASLKGEGAFFCGKFRRFFRCPPNAPDRVTDNAAVGRCIRAQQYAFKKADDEGESDLDAESAGNRAFIRSTPPLTGPSNIRDFVACVTYAVLTGVIPPKTQVICLQRRKWLLPPYAASQSQPVPARNRQPVSPNWPNSVAPYEKSSRYPRRVIFAYNSLGINKYIAKPSTNFGDFMAGLGSQPELTARSG